VPLFRRSKPSWEPDWQTFPGRVDDADALLHVDRAAVAVAPVEGLGVRLMVRVRLGATRPDGSPAGETAHQLYLFEDRLAGEITRRAAGHYVGRVVSGGECVFVCHLPAPASDLKLGGGPFTPELSHVDDPDWEYVRQVFTPDRAAEQRSYNRPLVQALVSRGDRVEVPRPIEHSAHFTEQKAASAAGAELRRLGYQVSASPEAEGGCTLTTTRLIPLTGIDEASITVSEIVRRHGGDYDGWGCDLVR
jgi:regulator of RNase E activity RraB